MSKTLDTAFISIFDDEVKQAYQGMGDKNKALEMFEKCKEMSDHPAFVRNIEKLIDNIRNS